MNSRDSRFYEIIDVFVCIDSGLSIGMSQLLSATFMNVLFVNILVGFETAALLMCLMDIGLS